MTNNQRIEASREARLWIGQIVVPALACAAATLSIPEVREAVKVKAIDIKQKIQAKIKK